MKTEVIELLEKLYKRYSSKHQFGKICQMILVLAISDSNKFRVNEVRLVEGVDIDIEDESKKEKFAIEVKTTKSSKLSLRKKDIDSLRKRLESDNYQPVLAVLRIVTFSDWLFVKANSLRSGNVLIDSLRPYRIKELEDKFKPQFEHTVKSEFRNIMQKGQRYLLNKLKENGIKVSDI